MEYKQELTMDIDANELFDECLTEATMVVKQVRREEFGFPTPDTEWSVRDLLGHMLYELSWVPDIVSGKTIQEVGDKYEGDLLEANENDVATTWELAATKVERVVEAADLDATAHLSFGDVSVGDYLRQVGAELLIHAWDLGQAIGITARFDDAIAHALYDDAKERADDMQGSGLFAPPLHVPGDASIETKLLALYGRSAATWRDEQGV
jgi:uncharacterized protein (TIGR03086 family)